ncbi:restriction endonuclease subunit S [Anoxybacillus sp. J5B_2022]|uniref:restriction endonuclease subunit S n=1 Tax=Anoxybacillus sp. J5B_2022 TaxID=3003246 RepID=UPI002286CA48|nr:restriction endonuclease subunit S [Anoxybacillus sp. J5B_2022]MCZ0755598.1 restriction endonuclease subunit S [Anoxybacillus sp. J5B_2022]
MKTDAKYVTTNYIADRLDANYYSNKYFAIEQKIKNSVYKVVKYQDICDVIKCGPFGSSVLAENYNDTGIIMIRPLNLKEVLLSEDELVRFPEESLGTDFPVFEAGDILFTRVGTPSCSIIPNSIGKITISPNIIASKLKKTINQYYVAIFLNTVYGLNQLERRFKAVSQPTISTDEIKTIDMVLPDVHIQNYIGNKLRKAEELREEAKLLKEEAEKSLNQFLKLDSLEQKINNVLHIKANYVLPNDMNDRLDSEHYKKKFTILYEHLKELERSKVKVLSLKKIIDEGSYGILPDSQDYGKGELIFIRSTDLNDYMIDLDSCEKVPDKYLTPKATVSPGDILLEIKGAIAGGAIVPDIKTNAIVNGSIFRFRVKNDFNNFYILSVLQSIIGSLQKEQHGANSVISYLSLDVINNLKIPVIDIEKQNEIGDKLKKFVENNMKAKNLIKSAKQDVEDLIEGKFDESKISEGV